MKPCKDLFVGMFNCYGEMYVERCYANSEKQAKFLMVRRIAKEKGVHAAVLFREFDGKKDNFSVRLEVKFEEED